MRRKTDKKIETERERERGRRRKTDKKIEI